MAKTYEALKRAEEERKEKMEDLPVPPKIGPLKIPARLVAETHRLKYNLLRLTSEKHLKAILFSACNEGEGASTVLFHFAITLASDGAKVLLVDANLRSPSLHAVLKMEREKGLSDLLQGRSPVDGVTRETRVPNLLLIPSGSPYPNPTILLESDFLGTLIKGMKEKADWVLFDSSPITRYMDPIVLAPRVDGVVMVVQAEKTHWEEAESSRQRILSGNGRFLGVVLNKRRYHIPQWLYKRL